VRVADRLAQWPIAAIYSSPSQRAIETVLPLAERLRLPPELVPDLRERELPPVRVDDFDAVVHDTWLMPDRAPHGGESNRSARARGLEVVRRVLERHGSEDVVLSTHGTLLALIMSALDNAYDYQFWRRMSFPDIYCLRFDEMQLVDAERVWKP
jgi:2,3-bisphosphoglycerate-dependent phosphoglycerate mutase